MCSVVNCPTTVGRKSQLPINIYDIYVIYFSLLVAMAEPEQMVTMDKF